MSSVAKLVCHRTVVQKIGGSSPTGASQVFAIYSQVLAIYSYISLTGCRWRSMLPGDLFLKKE